MATVKLEKYKAAGYSYAVGSSGHVAASYYVVVDDVRVARLYNKGGTWLYEEEDGPRVPAWMKFSCGTKLNGAGGVREAIVNYFSESE